MANEDTNALDQHLAKVLERIGEVARADQWKQVATSSLSPLQLRIMGFLADHTQERIGVARLALELQVSRPTISNCARVLVERGLLKRTDNALDGRSHSMGLTGQGRKAIGANSDGTALERAISALRKADKEVLLLGSMNVLQALVRNGAVDVQRMCWTCVHYEGDRSTTHRCTLLGIVLKPADLRTDCPEHQLKERRVR